MQLTTRRQNVLTGAIALLLLCSTVIVGVKAAFGAYDGGYKIVGVFTAAGQGLQAGSDVKINGVKVGEVRSIELVHQKAQVTLRINDGEHIPKASVARIRAKTLFGEKFVDLDLSGADETKGPFIARGGTIAQTEGGFELEEVLTDLYPVLKAVDPAELMTVISSLADAGDGLGPVINRTLVNGAPVAQVFADNVDNTAKFLTDLAALSDTLADHAEDLVGIAEAGNVVLPTLNDGEDQVVDILQQAGRLSNDVADLLEHNKAFVDASLGDGSRTVQLLSDHRDQVVPLVVGLRQYIQTLASATRIKMGDGTLMAAVKAVLAGQVCEALPCPGGPGPGASVAAPAASPADIPSILADPLAAVVASSPGDQLFRFLSRVLAG